MIRYLSGIFLFFMPFLAQAIETDNVPVPVPANADPTGMIVFVIIFVGTIGGFFYVLWRNERKRKKEQEGPDK